MNDIETERERLRAEYKKLGPCDMTISGVYCPRFRSPDSAAGLCGPCLQRQSIIDRIDALRTAQ
jgi:hypothetical protein